MGRRLVLVLLPALLVLTGVLAYVAYYKHQAQTAAPPPAAEATMVALGERRPDFDLEVLAGGRATADEWDGKIVLFNFWAAWCPPCRREIPGFVDVWELYQDQGFEVVGVAIDERDAIEKFLDGLGGARYAQLIGHSDAMAVAAEFGNASGGLPYSALVDRDGLIRFTKQGELSKEALLTELEKLLAGAPSEQ